MSNEHVHVNKHVQEQDGKKKTHISTHTVANTKAIHTHTHTHVVTDASGNTHTKITVHTHRKT
jgi:hypothetical protein